MKYGYFRNTLTVAALSLTLLCGAAVPSASAATNAELEAQIQSLLQQIKNLQEVKNMQNGQLPGSCSLSLMRNLSLGSTGSDVAALQKFLNRDAETRVALYGAGAPGLETSYFGPRTYAAVQRFQNKYRSAQVMMNGIVDSGTRIQLSALCANINGQTTTPSQTTGTVSATRGSEYDSTLTIGDTGVVYAVAVKAGTLNETVESISFDFSKDPSKYIDSFNLYKNNTRVQNIDAKKATLLNGQYRLTLKDLRTDIARNTTETFTLHAEVKDSLASSYADDSISVLVPTHGVRAHDTTNSIMTTPNSDLAERTFDFTRDANNTNSNQTDSDLNITESSDNPDDTEVSVSKSNTTSNVLVIASDIEAQQSDITLSDIFVTIESDHTDVRDVVRSLRLMQGNTTLDTGEVVQNGGTPITAQDSNGDRQTLVDADEYYVHFTSIDNLTIREGDTETVELRVSFEKQSNSTYDDNTDITFTVRAIEGRDQDDNRIVANDLDIGSNSTFTLQVN